MISNEITLRQKAQVLLRVPALREPGQVIFPDIGPMSDDAFINLIGYALRSGYRVYVKDMQKGQAAMPIVKTDGRVTLLVSSAFRAQVQRLRAQYRLKRVPRLKSPA
jgi:hypothetical protein